MIPLGVTNARSERRELTTKVERDAVALASLAEDTLESGAASTVQALTGIADAYRRDTGASVVVVDDAGLGLVDTDPPAPGQRSFASRPEFEQALGGEVATGDAALGHARHRPALRGGSRRARAASSTERCASPIRCRRCSDRVLRYWLMLAAIAAVVLAVVWVVGLAPRPLGGEAAGATSSGRPRPPARAI